MLRGLRLRINFSCIDKYKFGRKEDGDGGGGWLGGGGDPATDYFLFCFHRKQNLKQRRLRALVVVDVGLHVLGCPVDILGTNCKKLLKLKMSGGGGGGLQLQYV